MLRAQLGDVLVLDLDQRFGQVTFRPVIILGGRRAQHLDVDAHGVHIGEPLLDAEAAQRQVTALPRHPDPRGVACK